jgi:hypothetical protein
MIDLNTYSPYLYDKNGKINECEDDRYSIIAKDISWDFIELNLVQYYDPSINKRFCPIRLMAGLLLLTLIDDTSIECVINRWMTDVSYKTFTGINMYRCVRPCAPSALIKFKQKIGQEGLNIILKASEKAFTPRKFSKMKKRLLI